MIFQRDFESSLMLYPRSILLACTLVYESPSMSSTVYMLACGILPLILVWNNCVFLATKQFEAHLITWNLFVIMCVYLQYVIGLPLILLHLCALLAWPFHSGLMKYCFPEKVPLPRRIHRRHNMFLFLWVCKMLLTHTGFRLIFMNPCKGKKNTVFLVILPCLKCFGIYPFGFSC